MTEGDAPVKEDGRVIILEVLGDCNSTFIVAEVSRTYSRELGELRLTWF